MPINCRTGSAKAWWVCSIASLILLSACQPTVKVEAPSEPIVINLNVKIEQEVRVKIEKDVEDLLADEDLF